MSSSSSKKKRTFVQCRFCANFYLPKDLEVHGRQQQDYTPTTTANALTPMPITKTAIKNGRRKKTAVSSQNNQSVNSIEIGIENGNGCCDALGFIQSQLPLIQPNKGLALREELSDLRNDSSRTRWDQCFPMELHGWHRQHSALVHPEVINLLGVPPRSAFVLIPTDFECCELSIFSRRVITLWPSKEISPLKIAFAHSFKSVLPCNNEQQQLFRLMLITSYASSVTSLTLRPNTAQTKLQIASWNKLAKLSHFPFFMRSYFVNALIFIDQQHCLEILYYGRLIVFDIINFECKPQQQSLEQQLENCKLNAEENTHEKQISIATTQEKVKIIDDGAWEPTIYRISPFCKFIIEWEEFLNDECERIADLKSRLL